MTVCKFSSSGKQFQVIDDFGNVYGTSRVALDNLTSGKVRQGFVMLTRLPFKVSKSRFGQSPLYEIPGMESTDGDIVVVSTDNVLKTSNDALNVVNVKSAEVVRAVEDKVVW
jgi:hypothetical protein